MPYRIYLIDEIEYAELDTENIDLNTVFSTADITDVGARRDSGVKNVIFKGTKKNNEAFGNLFHLNKVSQFEDSIPPFTTSAIFSSFPQKIRIPTPVGGNTFFYTGQVFTVTSGGDTNNGRVLTVIDVIAFSPTETDVYTQELLLSYTSASATFTDSGSVEIKNRLFFNYNPLRTVEALIYEDAMLIFKGALRVTEVNVNKDGEVQYATVITGNFIEFKNVIQDRLLTGNVDTTTDLDFSDLKHRYTTDVIVNSWNSSIETTDISGALQTIPFEIGTGYVYPFIDYGYTFRDTGIVNRDSSFYFVHNFRPAIYVNEYFKKIFNQKGLEGFSYEIKGSDEFKNKFNSLIIPNAGEVLTSKLYGFYERFAKDSGTVDSNAGGFFYNDSVPLGAHTGDTTMAAKLLTLDNFTPLVSSLIPTPAAINPFIIKDPSQVQWLIDNASVIPAVVPPPTWFFVDRTVTTDAKIIVKFSTIHTPKACTFSIQLVERDELDQAPGITSDPANNALGPRTVDNLPDSALPQWEVIAETFIHLNDNETVPDSDSRSSFNLPIGERQYVEKKQLAVRVFIKYDVLTFPAPAPTWTVFSSELRFPKDDKTQFVLDAQINSVGVIPDRIIPTPPANVKQVDFIKSIINLLNLYVYTDPEDSKRLIFQNYNDYYAFTSPEFIKTNSLNWTDKVDYKTGIKITSNLSIPKSYLFTWKDDSDWINDIYKKKYAEVYGSFKFNDALGVVDSKKVELIFSPSPITQFNSNRLYPSLYQIDGKNKKPFKTNIRILYYNGLKVCDKYFIGKDKYVFTSGIGQWTTETIDSKAVYPQVSNYWYIPYSNIPIEDLYFGRPREWYFTVSDEYINASTSYTNFYSNQITELTNPNLFLVEAFVLLNEIDIGGSPNNTSQFNLDLKVPVFIDMGSSGHSYFKVLNVEYTNNYTPAKVLLQKVVLGTER